MLSIAIYSTDLEFCNQIKEIIQDYLIEYKTMARVSLFQEVEKIEMVSRSYDLYIIDMDSETIGTIELGLKLKENDKGSKFLYISHDINLAFQATDTIADCFLCKPIPVESLKKIITKVWSNIKSNSVIIQTTVGERRVRIDTINYINIIKRCLCYHLNDGSMFDGQTLRVAFDKATANLINNENFIFIDPSLLINLGEIQILEHDHVIFENGDIAYFPKKHYDLIRERWIAYSKVIE